MLSIALWVRMDSNHRSRRQQIYSLPHLATLEHTLFSMFTFPLWGPRGFLILGESESTAKILMSDIVANRIEP